MKTSVDGEKILKKREKVTNIIIDKWYKEKKGGEKQKISNFLILKNNE